ncbi:ABC transporter permease [Streptococcus sciuri]|uniref:ABC transporter permease n=1 Tax=Streptococcus sciuri TaxID=2973939 RepID=A0ABT2F5P2_9STRE|nr:ABC transporter permease [Streptococcus sciuri]MCS4487801.1 ABC transporter permease [Streptococcus sciuri]
MSFALWKKLVSHSIQEVLINRQTAVITFVLGSLFFTLEIIAGFVFFEYTDTLLGFTKQDYLLLVATSSTITFLYQTLFVVSHEHLAETILEGELDATLLKPVDSFWYFVLYRLDIPSFCDLIISVVAQIYFLSSYKLEWLQLVFFVISILLATYLLFLLNQLAVSIVFWKDNANSILGLPEYLMEFSSRPLTIYPSSVRFILTWGVPILISTNLPVLIVKGKLDIVYLVFLIIMDVLGTFVARWVWKKGVVRYHSAN